MIKTVLTSALVALLATPASAQEEGGDEPLTRSALAAKLEANFRQLDTDASGSVGKAEIEAGQSRVAQETREAMLKGLESDFSKLDGNKDGMLSLAEFQAQAPTVQPRSVADQTIRRLDADKDQSISLAEYSASALARFDRLDVNKDGHVSEEERRAAQQRSSLQGR